MISFPNAKINLGLHVIDKRSDGYHNIETCFYPISWNDALEIIPARETCFTSSGIVIPGDTSNNLCLKVYQVLKKRYNIPSIHIHLHKHIPIGAGLGGGSADAAHTTMLINTYFNLKMTNKQLEDCVRDLGSDCAFFIQNKPLIAHEKGDRFTDINCIDLSSYWIYLIYPGIHVSTKDAYNNIRPNADRLPIINNLRGPIESWKETLVNDFEKSVFSVFPEIAKLKEQLYKHGAIYAAMSGSGSTVFGIFKDEPKPFMKNKEMKSLITKML
jgi:4-diphosphocytidyl-2-C-methyl-D-erythritol kinase